jgi:hypothetical protein
VRIRPGSRRNSGEQLRDNNKVCIDIECASELEARTLCSAFKVMVRQIKQK